MKELIAEGLLRNYERTTCFVPSRGYLRPGTQLTSLELPCVVWHGCAGWLPGLLCWTQQQIADTLKVPRQTVGYWLSILGKGTNGNLGKHPLNANNDTRGYANNPPTLYPCRYEDVGDAIAKELGVPRRTLSRWFGNNHKENKSPTLGHDEVLSHVGTRTAITPRYLVVNQAGEMLAEMAIRPGNPQWSHDVTNDQPKLAELGISKMQSHRWQLEAIYQARAKERQREHGNTAPGRNKTLCQNSDKVLDTKKELAALWRDGHKQYMAGPGRGHTEKKTSAGRPADVSDPSPTREEATKLFNVSRWDENGAIHTV